MFLSWVMRHWCPSRRSVLIVRVIRVRIRLLAPCVWVILLWFYNFSLPRSVCDTSAITCCPSNTRVIAPLMVSVPGLGTGSGGFHRARRLPNHFSCPLRCSSDSSRWGWWGDRAFHQTLLRGSKTYPSMERWRPQIRGYPHREISPCLPSNIQNVVEPQDHQESLVHNWR